MSSLPPGPYRTITSSTGAAIPYYIIPFDKKGRCTGPLSRQHLIDNAAGYSDIYVFSHGWNNDWPTATKRYESFIEGVMEMRASQGLPTPGGYRPLLVGIFWPSAVLVHDDEKAPKIAAGGEPAVDLSVELEQDAIAEIASELPPGNAEEFYELIQRDALDDRQILRLAQLVQPVLAAGQDEIGAAPPDAEDLAAAWKNMTAPPQQVEEDPNEFGTVGPGGGANAAPAAAGWFDKLLDLPRNAIRGTTVWMMKDRAGVVGSKGVAPLLVELLTRSQARVHLLGHSFGGKVVLSALCSPTNLPRKVHSALLLQPAVSHLCFADTLPGGAGSGGYRKALDRVQRPILSTFSSEDVPLTKTFHLALVRESDLGEMKIAAAGQPPSRFAALGGFGPRGAGEVIIDMQLPPQGYKLDENKRLYGMRGDKSISGHGDISNPATWWALHELVRG